MKNIKKRDGSIVEFNSSKITSANAKAVKASGEFGESHARKLTLRVLNLFREMHVDKNLSLMAMVTLMAAPVSQLK